MQRAGLVFDHRGYIHGTLSSRQCTLSVSSHTPDRTEIARGRGLGPRVSLYLKYSLLYFITLDGGCPATGRCQAPRREKHPTNPDRAQQVKAVRWTPVVELSSRYALLPNWKDGIIFTALCTLRYLLLEVPIANHSAVLDYLGLSWTLRDRYTRAPQSK